jgi:hypothetical protein
MLELRAQSPEDHDGFLRTVDQLLAVSNRIVDIVSAPLEAAPLEAAPLEAAPLEAGQGGPETETSASEGGDAAAGSAIEGGAEQGAAGGAEDDAG